MVSVTKEAGEVHHIHIETQIRFVKRNASRSVLAPGYQKNIADPIYIRHAQKVGNTVSHGSDTYLISQLPKGRATFVGGGTCTTPSVPVKLPDADVSEFSRPGPLLTKTTAFELEFQSCPAGLYGIGYYFTPTTAILDAAQGVIALDGRSTATGIALQLMQDNGAALQFGPANTYPLAYDPSTVNTYKVPLKVSYYQTSASITSGTVSASMTVTLKYQ